MLRFARLFAVCLLAAPLARAQEVSTPAPAVIALVPVVGTIMGVGEVQWRTDVVLQNPGRSEATVSLILPTAPDQPAMVTTIPPGGTVNFTDIVGQAFGMAAALSPLLVETLGRSSVRIAATAYGVHGSDVYKPEPIDVAYGDPYYPMRVLPGLSFNDDYRTNIGLANLSDEPATFTLALQRVLGRNLSITRIVVPPNTLFHQSVQAYFPMITGGEDFAVLIETPYRDTYVYASVIENATNTAHFVQPLIGVQTSAE
jgi:xanthosine utilization system XapX-like protein